MKPFLHKGPCLTSSHTKLWLTSVRVLLPGNTHRMGPLISLYICIGNGVAEKSQEEKKKNIWLPLVILMFPILSAFVPQTVHGSINFFFFFNLVNTAWNWTTKSIGICHLTFILFLQFYFLNSLLSTMDMIRSQFVCVRRFLTGSTGEVVQGGRGAVPYVTLKLFFHRS